MSKNSELHNPLPTGWVLTDLKNIGEWNGGGTPSKTNSEFWQNGRIPWFSPKDIKSLRLSKSIDNITENAILGSAAKKIKKNSVLYVVRSGILRNSLPVSITAVPCAVNQDIKALTLYKEILPDYVLYYSISKDGDIRQNCAKNGTTVESIETNALKSYPISLPPLNEQKRIVAKIEELFTKLDAGKAALEKARLLLKQYRRSLLKHAFEGKLTARWREENRGKIEPASVLLEKIREERKAKLGKKYREPEPVDASGLPELPDGWVWARVGMLGELNRGKSKHRPRNAPFLYGGPYPFIQTGDIANSQGTIKSYRQTYSEKGLAQSRLWPENTLCITIAANIGDVAILGLEACFPDSVVGFLPQGEHISVDYVYYYMKYIKDFLESNAPATAQKNINLSILNDITVPVAPLEEQLGIVSQLEYSFSIIQNIESTLSQTENSGEALKSSILKSAFAGKLVPQEPADEPAAELLRRIKEEAAQVEQLVLPLRRKARGKKKGVIKKKR